MHQVETLMLFIVHGPLSNKLTNNNNNNNTNNKSLQSGVQRTKEENRKHGSS